MQDSFALQKLEQVKALTDPLRQRILQALCQEPLTTKKVAQQLGEKPTRLYHHVAALERAGLVQIVETRQKRGTVEKYYRAVARKFVVDKKLFELAPGSETALSEAQALIVSALDDTLTQVQDPRMQDLLETPNARERLVFARAQGMCVTPGQIAALGTKIDAWLEECGCGADVQDAEGPTYALTLILYPTFEADAKS